MTLPNSQTTNNIANFFWFNSNHIGGIETHLKNLLSRTTNNYLFCGQPATTANERYIKLLDYKQKYPDTPEYNLKQIFSELGHNTLINFHNPHTFSVESTLRLISLLRELNSASKIVCTIHNITNDLDPLNKVSTACDSIFTVSNFMADVLLEKIGVQSTVVPYILDINFPKDIEMEFDFSSLNVLQPTRFCNWKGSHHSLAATIELLEEGMPIRFTHAGVKSSDWLKRWDLRWDKEYPNLRNKVATYVEAGAISFIEYESPKFYTTLNNYNLVLHPTMGIGIEGDPYPLSLQMAILNPIPIITTSSGGIPEIVSNLSFVSLLSPHNVNDLSQELKKLYKSKKRSLSKSDKAIISTKRDSAINAIPAYNRIMNLHSIVV
jgi:glycosyltransferase involved in cell wall biosynthesis